MFLQENRLKSCILLPFQRSHIERYIVKVIIIHRQNALLPAGFVGTSDASVK